MDFFKNYPFVRLLSFQLAGVWIANFCPLAEKLFYLLFLILTFLLIRTIRQKKYPFELVHSAILCVLIVIAACHRVSDHQLVPQATQKAGTSYFEARVLSHPIEKVNSLQTIAKIVQGDSLSSGQKVMVYLKKNEKSWKLRAGDRIIAKGVLLKIRNAGNPYEFNYKKYMERKHILYRVYLDQDHFMVRKSDNRSVRINVRRFQEKLVSQLKEKLHSAQAFQVVAAIALGYRDELSQETQSYFISTGAIHVLSVSGLHVAMIFLFLNNLFSFLKRSNTGNILYFIIITAGLWGYALLTGFSPPVQRAVVMFSFILIGNSLSRPASIYNSIAASAFFLLFSDPDLIFDVGFQLSYMAVTSIVFFYPRLSGLLRTENRPAKYAWQLACVSIAAQIGASPLSIYYFNQFPLYFWLSNFVVVPAGYLILALTGAFLAFSDFGFVASAIAEILCITADATLFLLKKIGDLPGAVVDRLSVSLFQFFCLFTILGLLMLFIVYKKHVLLFGGVFCLLLFQLAGLVQKAALFNQRVLIVYQSKERLIHLINGRTNYLLNDSDAPPDPFLYKNVLVKLKLSEPSVIHLEPTKEIRFKDLIFKSSVIQFTNRTLIIDLQNQLRPLPGTVMTSPGYLDLNRTAENTILIPRRPEKAEAISSFKTHDHFVY